MIFNPGNGWQIDLIISFPKLSSTKYTMNWKFGRLTVQKQAWVRSKRSINASCIFQRSKPKKLGPKWTILKGNLHPWLLQCKRTYRKNPLMTKLAITLLTLPHASAEAERIFSQMKLIKTLTRN